MSTNTDRDISNVARFIYEAYIERTIQIVSDLMEHMNINVYFNYITNIYLYCVYKNDYYYKMIYLSLCLSLYV